jgi:hypothetical protein
MMLHWNGTAWTRVAGPDISNLGTVFSLSPTEAWVVGANETSPGVYTLDISNWNGTTWSTPTAIPLPAGALGHPDPGRIQQLTGTSWTQS